MNVTRFNEIGNNNYRLKLVSNMSYVMLRAKREKQTMNGSYVQYL